MRASTKSIAKGFFHEIQGTLKQIIGDLSSNKTLGMKGKLECMTGKVERKVGKIQGKFGF